MDSISWKDKSSFGYIIGSSMAIGAIASVIFHVFTKNGEHGEETAEDINSFMSNSFMSNPFMSNSFMSNSFMSYAFKSSSDDAYVEKMTVLDWLKEPKTYLARI